MEHESSLFVEVTPRRKLYGIIVILFLIIFLGIGVILLKLDPHIPLILASITASIFAFLDGSTWKTIEKGMIESIMMSMQAIIILLVIGILIASWLSGGIVQAMIYYGLNIINPNFFFVSAVILSSIIALATGSSWTTIGTIGIALMGISNALGFDPAITAGAIVSGAYFGDKMSPLSDTTNLAPAIAGTTLFDHIKSMQYTTIPSFVIALIIYLVLGFNVTSSSVDLNQLEQIQAVLVESYNINYFLLLPPLLIIAMVKFKVPALPGLIVAVGLGILSTIIIQGNLNIENIMQSLHYGYEFSPDLLPATLIVDPIIIEDVTNLLTAGGLDSMMWTISLILCAMCFGGAMEASGFLPSVVSSFSSKTQTKTSLVTASIFTSIIVNILAADQYVSIVIAGRTYKASFRKLKLAPRVHSRIIESGSTLTSPLVPWNTCGATIYGFLGVSSIAFLPYAFFNLINPLLEIVAARFNYAMFEDDGSDHATEV